MISLGNQQMLTLVALTDKGEPKQDKFKTLINPEKVELGFSIEYAERQALGAASTNAIYSKMPPSTMNFDLILDGSGLINILKTSVEDQLEDLNKVVYDYSSKDHKPNFVSVQWGSANTFDGRLEKMSVSVTKFRPDGTFLRAKVSLGFKHVTFSSPSAGQQSPDMTHLVEINSGNLLPLLTEDIYEDPNHLLKVARHNDLDSLLYLESGEILQFPPIK